MNLIEPHITLNSVHLPLDNDMRWTIIEKLCEALAKDDDAAGLMLKIADAAANGERATYDLMKLDAIAGTTYAAIKMSPVEARMLADDLLYITPDPKEQIK